MNDNSSQHALRTSRSFNVLSALLAFLLWGGWAFYVNGRSDIAKGLLSGLTQGTASFIITLVMVYLVTWFFKQLPDNCLQIPLSALFTVSITGSFLIAVHLLVKTPEIFYTISPALSVAFAFCWYTAYKLRKTRPKRLSK